MLGRSPRSRSRTADPVPSKGSTSLTTTLPSSPLSPAPAADDLRATETNSPDSLQPSGSMAPAVTTQTVEQETLLEQCNTTVVEHEHHDHADDRSSSLSELEDGIEEQDEVQVVIDIEKNDMDVDSETETERLERTPRKPADGDASASYTDKERSPSKLVQEVLPEDSSSSHQSPLSLDVGSSSRKRKRPSSEASSLSDPELEKPLSKRNHASQDFISTMDQGDPRGPEIEPVEGDEKLNEQDEGRDNEDVDIPAQEEEVEASHVVSTSFPVPLIRAGKGKKGKRKGRKPITSEAATDTGENSEDVPDSAEAAEEGDEEESSSIDEELVKKKAALEALSLIEKQFTPFREKHLSEQLRRVENELELLRDHNSRHPEFLAQLTCIDERRNGKIRYEDTLLGFEIQALRIRTVAERGQHHSQYHQDCRKIRDESLESCYKEFFALKNDRMRYGAVESPDLLLYNPKRSDQILQQTKKSAEISILSGVSKYRGFAAAPDIRCNSAADIDRDFQAMGIPTTARFPNAQPILTANRGVQPTVDEQFLEQNLWANPQAAYQLHTPNFINTPAGQRRTVDANGTNGSGSTLELSNPPSSAPRPPPEQTDSPILNNKRILSTVGTTKAAVSRLPQDATERITTTHVSSSQPQAPEASASASASASAQSGPSTMTDGSANEHPFARFNPAVDVPGLSHPTSTLPQPVGQFAS